MASLIDVLDRIDKIRDKETETIAFRSPFIGVLSYARTNNPKNWINFYIRRDNNTIIQEIFLPDEAEVVNESPLSFRLTGTGGATLYEGNPGYEKAQNKLRSFGLH